MGLDIDAVFPVHFISFRCRAAPPVFLLTVYTLPWSLVSPHQATHSRSTDHFGVLGAASHPDETSAIASQDSAGGSERGESGLNSSIEKTGELIDVWIDPNA